MKRWVEYWAATLLLYGIVFVLVGFGIVGLWLWGWPALAEFMAGYFFALWLFARDEAKAARRRAE